MKRPLVRVAVVLLCALLFGCSNEEDADGGAGPLGGDGNIPLNTVGNVISTGDLTHGTTQIPFAGTLTVLSNDNGLVTARLEVPTADLMSYPGFAAAIDAILPQYKDGSGNISAELTFKSTTEGMADYANVDGKEHILVRYADGPGAEYSLAKSNGRTLTRRVVAKSTEDDFEYGFYFIKVSTVEMELNVGGVRKVVYRVNHRFGIVHVEAELEDASTVSGFVYSQYD